MRRGYSVIRENSGKLIALITAILAILLTFAEVGLPSVIGAELGADILVMLVASYIIYFSLEGAGERLGRDTDIYKEAESAWKERRKEISGDMVGALRDFCIRYSSEELYYRRRAALMAAGLTADDYRAYIGDFGGEENFAAKADGKRPFKIRERCALHRISRMKPIPLSPTTLLGGGAGAAGSELKNPERNKLFYLVVGLLPTTICMLFTVSMMITAKSGLDMGAVISGIVKLSALPMIAMRGYSRGYDYSRITLPAWLETKAKLLSAFLSGENNESYGA